MTDCCYYGINDMVPTHNPKSPWATVGTVGGVIDKDKVSVLFDDGSWLDIPLG